MLSVSPRVREALAQGRAVVALESTIISHGMPWPQNAETALEVEQVVLAHGAVPATIAVLDGVIKVGLEPDEIRAFGKAGNKARKLSSCDLGWAVASGLEFGATTVASTMRAAALAGIDVFVTGGIGGVHRGAEVTMDVSADLTELSRTPVAVVCAGIKSILDIPKTLEKLETFGIPVLGFQSNQFPAFFTADSGCSAPIVARDEMECARIIRRFSKVWNLS